MDPRRVSILGALLFAACSRCPDALPPEPFCFVWPPPAGLTASGSCPAPEHASLLLQADGTDARGAPIEDPFYVLGPSDAPAGHCCYVVQQTPPCP
jgi:hypothetical protein